MHHGVNHKYLDDCESSGPRPPVPGQESRLHHNNMTETGRGGGSGCGSNSPGLLHIASSSISTSATSITPGDYSRVLPSSASFNAITTSSSAITNNSHQQCKWNQNLSYLLEDAEGADLFKRYVESEGGIHADRLKFYFACEGLKMQTEDATIKQMVRAIYRFLRKSQLSLAEDLRGRIKNGLATEAPMDANIFNNMQLEMVHHIRDTTYPNFLQSELYCNHIDTLAHSASAGGAAGGASMMVGFNQPHYRETMPGGSGSLFGCVTSVPRTLSTLHEDTEFFVGDSMPAPISSAGSVIDGPTSGVGGGVASIGGKDKPHVRLTRDMLLATQERRLELRPQGAHGYTSKFSSSYNPVSRQDSGRQSCSSGGGMTDSETMSVTNSRDGRTHPRRSREHSGHPEHPLHMNPQTNSYVVVPLTSRIKTVRPPNQKELLSALIPKLEELQRDQKTKERLDQMMYSDDASSVDGMRSYRGAAGCGGVGAGYGQPGQVLTDAILKKLQPDDDNDQSILDQHVLRVWSDLTPHRSPGTVSPCPDMQRMRSHDMGIGSDGSSIGGSMRHSRSMPEPHSSSSSSRRITNKWSSMNTDSGISMFSMDQQPMCKPRESTSRTRAAGVPMDSSISKTILLEEARRRLEEEASRKSKSRYPPYPPQSQVPMAAPPMASMSQEFTVAVYTFRDEDLPYRSKLPSLHPTLRLFKDYLPKKGNFRFFFKTACDDPDSPVIQEEIVNDADVLPLFEGKVMALVKPQE